VNTGSGSVVELDPVAQDVTREQSTVATTLAGPRKVKTRAVGHVKLKVTSSELVQVVATTTAGVAKAIEVVAGQSIVMAPVIAVNVTVVIVAPGTLIETLMGVKYVVLVGKPGSLLIGKVAGSVYTNEGPPLIWGQGGRETVRVVWPPAPSGSVTTTGETSTLGKTVMGMAPELVTLTLEKPIPLVTIGVTERVTVVVVVTKTIVSTPPMIVFEKPPYSSEVT
jgi:hypothetical protein